MYVIEIDFAVYYDVDDAKDAITINIRLTKANYNRMWEIKVRLGGEYILVNRMDRFYVNLHVH